MMTKNPYVMQQKKITQKSPEEISSHIKKNLFKIFLTNKKSY